MALSFTVRQPGALNGTPARSARRRVLVTGAAGNIGSFYAEKAHGKYDLRLMVREQDKGIDAIRPHGQVVFGDLDDLEQLKRYCQGVDTVLHLAASASPSSVWADLLNNNIVGTYNVFVAAKAAGCRRVIYASSIHAVSGYPKDVQVKATDPVNPGDLYGVSKCFGEALARYMAEQEGLSAVALRIGAFQPPEKARADAGLAMMDAWVSRRDLQQLIERCIEADNLQFAIFNGLSDNRFKRLDIADARELVGYAPQDDLTRANPKVRPLRLPDQVGGHNVKDGGKSGIREELQPGRKAPGVRPAKAKPAEPAAQKRARGSTPRARR